MFIVLIVLRMCTFSTMSAERKKYRPKVESKVLVRAYVKRKNDILRPDMTVLPLPSPGWSLLASDLGNVYASSTLRAMVRREDIKEALIKQKRSTDVSYVPSRSRGRRPIPLVPLVKLSPRNYRRQPKIESRDHVIDDVPTQRTELALLKGSPNEKVSKEGAAPDNTKDLKVGQSNLEVHHKIHQRQVRVNIDKMLVLGAQPVVPKVCPDKNTLKEEPESSQTAKNTDNTSLVLNANYKAPQAEINLKRVVDQILARRYPCKVDPSFVINEIVSRRAEIVKPTGLYAGPADPVWKRITDALGNKISPQTVWRMADRKDVREIMIDGKQWIATVSPENSPGRQKNVDRDVIAVLLQHRAEIVLPDGSYVSKESPVWIRIAKDLGNNFSATTVCQIAERPEVHQRMIIVDEKNIDTSSAGNGPRKRTKIDPQIAIDAILARKEEIVRSKQLYVPKEDPVWSRIADDLGNLIAPSTVHFMACRKDVRALLLQRNEKKNIRSLDTTEEEEDDTAGSEKFLNEINKMVFDDTVNKLLRTVNSTDGLVTEIKELRTDLQELRKDLQELKQELREQDDNNFGSQDQPILVD